MIVTEWLIFVADTEMPRKAQAKPSKKKRVILSDEEDDGSSAAAHAVEPKRDGKVKIKAESSTKGKRLRAVP